MEGHCEERPPTTTSLLKCQDVGGGELYVAIVGCCWQEAVSSLGLEREREKGHRLSYYNETKAGTGSRL